MNITRLVVKLSENGTVTDTTDTSAELVADGRNYPTRDLHSTWPNEPNGRVLGGRVTLLTPFGPGEPDPGLPAPAGLQVKFVAPGPARYRPATTTSGGLYQRAQLPATLTGVYVTNDAGKLLGLTPYNHNTALIAGWGNPAIAVQDLAIVLPPNSFVVSGRVLPPATPPTKPVVVTVSVEAYNGHNNIVASGNVHSSGYGDYRVEATPTPAFFAPTHHTTQRMNITRLVVKLSENGTVTDTTDTSAELVADGRNYPTRDLHG
jgi:hypothetical protein